MTKFFNDKVAVITGAGSGIGQALAVALAREGARLALSDIDRESIERTRALLPSTTDVRAYVLDVTQEAAVFAHANEVVRDFGRVDLLFNNAGSVMLGTLEHQTLDEVRWMIDLNLWSIIYCTKAFLPVLRSQAQAWIINISSMAGLVGTPALSTYNLTKFAVRGFTESLWAEFRGTGIHAICVCPGGIKTNISKAARRCVRAGELEARVEEANKHILVYPAERCAADILSGIRHGKKRILTGERARTMDWLVRLLPNSYPKLINQLLLRN